MLTRKVRSPVHNRPELSTGDRVGPDDARRPTPAEHRPAEHEGRSGNIRLVDLTKRFGAVSAVDRINLDVRAGEFFSMLGPSGCGKTTTLRMIAGFEHPTSGEIQLDGRDVASVPSYKRNVNTVFQSYALFPHLKVFDNIAFGLRRAGVARRDVRRRVAQALEMVQLTGLENRKPSQMSGGQQQRVALARAIVLHPAVLLLDEPLGALDAKLRKALQVELKALQQEVGITFVYVTHDQEEALTMSDRIAVMNAGRVEQVADPRRVYEEPETMFVADFLGVSNVMDAVARGARDGSCRVRLDSFDLLAQCGDLAASGQVKLVIRPERVRLEPHGTTGENRIPGMVERSVYLGNAVQLLVHLACGADLQALIQNSGGDIGFAQGAPVCVHLPPGALRVLSSAPTVSRPPAAQAQ